MKIVRDSIHKLKQNTKKYLNNPKEGQGNKQANKKQRKHTENK